ncbi:MAG: YhbY family RNA-binding protein [Oscillospiraceae bacterium]|nr:YhbY family RNA-binding protein [Oscillospiraceae bacterium]
MLTSKQRAVLKSIAAKEDTILQVGKNGIIDTLVTQVSDALKARELIKMKVQDGAMLSPAEAANELAEKTKSEVVQVIGNKFVLFKRNPQNPKIDLKTK